MKLPTTKLVRLAAVVSLGLSVCPAFAQIAPAAPEAKDDAAVKLDPFNVSADSDVGFVAASSLAGGRIATALKDSPVAYSVVTKEFLDAFNLTDVTQAAAFTVGSGSLDNDGTQRQYGRTDSSQLTIRGVQVGPILRTLSDKKLIRVAGRAEVPGRPLQYGTSQSFLDRFGLKSIEELPTLEELKQS